MKLLMFAASLRKDSFNKKLIKTAENIVKELNVTPHLIDYAELKAPIYNYDDEVGIGYPAEIKHFEKLLLESDGLVISSPEYNFTTPGTLKNLIDWTSRLNPTPLKNYPVLLMSASPAMAGGNRGLWNTRIPFEYCNAFVYPGMFSLSMADKAFNEQAQLHDENLHKRLKQNIADFIPYATALKNLRPGAAK
ncbi:MAG TPA: NAD(P)H-dependent oxidoreductase [Gammaproteobacteria bacterium]|nr:NAD(P)H-dependent oxidoreductase [Gammaproteobacteria bacterium]